MITIYTVKYWERVNKAHRALAAASAAGLKAQVALDNARIRFNRAADVLRAEEQLIDYCWEDVVG